MLFVRVFPATYNVDSIFNAANQAYIDKKYEAAIANYDILSKLKQVEEVKRISPYVSGKVLAYREGLTEVVSLKGNREK